MAATLLKTKSKGLFLVQLPLIVKEKMGPDQGLEGSSLPPLVLPARKDRPFIFRPE
jgi:hypothetical protein